MFFLCTMFDKYLDFVITSDSLSSRIGTENIDTHMYVSYASKSTPVSSNLASKHYNKSNHHFQETLGFIVKNNIRHIIMIPRAIAWLMKIITHRIS